MPSLDRRKVLHLLEEFKYLGDLFTNEGKMEREIDRWIVCRGKERAESRDKALDLPVDRHSYPPIRS